MDNRLAEAIVSSQDDSKTIVFVRDSGSESESAKFFRLQFRHQLIRKRLTPIHGGVFENYADLDSNSAAFWPWKPFGRSLLVVDNSRPHVTIEKEV